MNAAIRAASLGAALIIALAFVVAARAQGPGDPNVVKEVGEVGEVREVGEVGEVGEVHEVPELVDP